MPESKAAIAAARKKSFDDADYLGSLDADQAGASWRLTLRGNEVFIVPRSGLLRNLMLNRWYHHRGQLTVYSRPLDVPLPVVSGRTADENPFA